MDAFVTNMLWKSHSRFRDTGHYTCKLSNSINISPILHTFTLSIQRNNLTMLLTTSFYRRYTRNTHLKIFHKELVFNPLGTKEIINSPIVVP